MKINNQSNQHRKRNSLRQQQNQKQYILTESSNQSQDYSPNPLFGAEGTLDFKQTAFQFNKAFDLSQEIADGLEDQENDDFNIISGVDDQNLIVINRKKSQVQAADTQSKHSLNFTFESLSQGFINNPSGDPTLKQILDDYVPESKEIELEELRNSNNFYVKKYPDAIYFGECQKSHNGKNMRSGKGVMQYNNGRLFEGEWENDQRHGRGYERYPNGNIYQGEFQYGKAHGKGKYQWIQTEEIYDGEWSKGMRHGYGVWKKINLNLNQKYHDSYIGEWRHGKAEGFGVHTWSNGDRYEGEWKACMKHGKGTDMFANGDKYSGQYKNGKPEGFGVYTWANGNYYEGEFKNGLKEGKGKWKKYSQQKNQDSNVSQPIRTQFVTYEGEYKKDKKHGLGIFIWASGNTYKGSYKDDEREGHGEMKWTDGSTYIGEWIRGIQHGYGKIIYPDGTIKEGYFENNIYIGPLPRGEYLKQLQEQIVQQPPPVVVEKPKPKGLTQEEERQVNMIFSPNSLAKGGLKSLDKSKSRGYAQSQSPINNRMQLLNKYSIHQIDEENSQILSSLGVNSHLQKRNQSRQKDRTPQIKMKNENTLSRENFNEFLKQTQSKLQNTGKINGSSQSVSIKNQQYLMGSTPLSNRKQRMLKQNGSTIDFHNHHQNLQVQQNSRKQTIDSRNLLSQHKNQQALQSVITNNQQYLLQTSNSNYLQQQQALQTLKSSVPNLAQVKNQQQISRQSIGTFRPSTSTSVTRNQRNFQQSNSKQDGYVMQRRNSLQRNNSQDLSKQSKNSISQQKSVFQQRNY